MPTLQGKVALVTGSGRGIGQAIQRDVASQAEARQLLKIKNS